MDDDKTDNKKDSRPAQAAAPNKPRLVISNAIKMHGSTINALHKNGVGTDIVVAEEDKKKGQGSREKLASGLTIKQEGFAKDVGYNGKTLYQSYVDNYDAKNMNHGTIYTEASKLGSNPIIAQRVEHYFKQRAAQTSHKPEKIRAIIVDGLLDMLGDKTVRPNEKLKAYELLGKIDNVGLFKERSVTETVEVKSAVEIEERIKELLKTG